MNSLLRGNALLALAAAVLWGGGDFSGGMGVKAAGGGIRAALRVVLLSHAASFVALLTIARLRGDAAPHGALLAWGVAAGVAGGLSLTALYTALSRGAMGAAAAVSGLLAAAIPAGSTIWQDGSPGAGAMIGFAVAGAAIWLIAAGPGEAMAEGAENRMVCGTSRRAGYGSGGLALLAGVGFGIYFIALKNAGPAGVVWPMVSARMGSLCVCSLTLLALGVRSGGAVEARPRMSGRVVAWALATALLDTSGNLLFVAATRAGRLDVAAVLASLYPATTILLAALALGERPTRRQALGMMTAAAAVVLIAM
jgi:drug/metabolite transporter (DMT)-like permease